jgi:hypothetical protein
MPYSQQHQLISCIGDCYGATERWQFGLRITDGGVSNQVTADAVAPYFQTWWQLSTGDYFGPNLTHRLTEIKVARIDEDGTYPPTDVSASHFFVPPLTSTLGPIVGMLPQNTVVASLITALPRGLASKGRIYLPPSIRATVVDATGLMTTANAQALANSTWTLIQAINANSVVGNVAIFSRGKGVARYDAEHKRVEYDYPNPGAMNVVTGVRVGRVVDTQRRRRRQLVEQYVNDTN